jgi:HNH endonuclease
MAIRQLRPGEALPEGEARRYKAGHGYIRLRWRVGPREYVEVYEHRVAGGAVTTAEQVHHKNRIRDDNSPSNLARLTAEEHHAEHASPHGDAVTSAYLAGETSTVIAARLEVHPTTVTRLLEVKGIPRRPSYSYRTPIDRTAVRQLHAAGVRLRRIAAVLGVTHERVGRVLDDLDLPRFQSGRPTQEEARRHAAVIATLRVDQPGRST